LLPHPPQHTADIGNVPTASVHCETNHSTFAFQIFYVMNMGSLLIKVKRAELRSKQRGKEIPTKEKPKAE
jgi:hypothetical protein